MSPLDLDQNVYQVKNIKLLNGRPLVFHTIDAVLDHKMISKVVFTTDSDEYIDLVLEEYGDLITIEKRPEHFASDTTKVHDEIIRLADTNVIQTQWFMLCLPTAPMRDHKSVERFLEAWSIDNCARFSASVYDFPIQFAFDIVSDGDWKALSQESPMITGNTRSQDIPKRYHPNGAIYLQKTDSLHTNKTFYIDAKPFLLSPYESVDVDNEIDFKFAELLIGKKEHGKLIS